MQRWSVLLGFLCFCACTPSPAPLGELDAAERKDQGVGATDASFPDAFVTTFDSQPADVEPMDNGFADASLADAVPADAAPADAGTADAETVDLGVFDALPADVSAQDTGRQDAEAGSTDAGPMDANPKDAALPDASAADATSPDAAPGDAGTCPAPVDQCEVCLSMSCNNLYCGCAGHAECEGLYSCALSSCNVGDLVCLQDCWAQHPGAISDALLVDDCAHRSCAGICPWSQLDLTDCDRCLFAKCADESNACLATASCAALLICLGNCTNDSCRQGCETQYAAGRTLQQALNTCQVAACPTECN